MTTASFHLRCDYCHHPADYQLEITRTSSKEACEAHGHELVKELGMVGGQIVLCAGTRAKMGGLYP